MYLVDTSVWIHALRPSGHPAIQSQLKPLIVSGETAVTEWILLELMKGLTKTERPESFLRWFLPWCDCPSNQPGGTRRGSMPRSFVNTEFPLPQRIVLSQLLHWNIRQC